MLISFHPNYLSFTNILQTLFIIREALRVIGIAKLKNRIRNNRMQMFQRNGVADFQSPLVGNLCTQSRIKSLSLYHNPAVGMGRSSSTTCAASQVKRHPDLSQLQLQLQYRRWHRLVFQRFGVWWAFSEFRKKGQYYLHFRHLKILANLIIRSTIYRKVLIIKDSCRAALYLTFNIIEWSKESVSAQKGKARPRLFLNYSTITNLS